MVPTEHPSCAAISRIVRSACRCLPFHCPERGPCGTKSVAPQIKSADDQTGTFTGLASVLDNVDYDGDIVRRGAFSKSLGSGTPIPLIWLHKADDLLATTSAMSSRPARPTTVWRSRAGLISTPSSASRPTETPRAAECQV